MNLSRYILVILATLSLQVFAAEIETNWVHSSDAPAWATRNRIEKVVNHIQTVLEWDIRKIEVYFHSDEASFEKSNTLGPNIIAVSLKASNSVHLGPRVTNANFDQVFGHELVHIISFQKYKDAIPRWLEEGLANYLSKNGQVDYKMLASKPFPVDVRGLVHPVSGSAENIHYNYMASQALAEMIAKKCDLANLLRLSVGQNMDSYLDTYCEIHDLNADYRKWVKAHSGKP